MKVKAKLLCHDCSQSLELEQLAVGFAATTWMSCDHCGDSFLPDDEWSCFVAEEPYHVRCKELGLDVTGWPKLQTREDLIVERDRLLVRIDEQVVARIADLADRDQLKADLEAVQLNYRGMSGPHEKIAQELFRMRTKNLEEQSRYPIRALIVVVAFVWLFLLTLAVLVILA